MKIFTDREREAIEKVLHSYTIGRPDAMAKEIIHAVNQAEGLPAGTGDKYLDAKNKIASDIAKLNKSVLEASELGLRVTIGIKSQASGLPPSKDFVYNDMFELSRLTKDFYIAKPTSF